MHPDILIKYQPSPTPQKKPFQPHVEQPNTDDIIIKIPTTELNPLSTSQKGFVVFKRGTIFAPQGRLDTLEDDIFSRGESPFVHKSSHHISLTHFVQAKNVYG